MMDWWDFVAMMIPCSHEGATSVGSCFSFLFLFLPLLFATVFQLASLMTRVEDRSRYVRAQPTGMVHNRYGSPPLVGRVLHGRLTR